MSEFENILKPKTPDELADAQAVETWEHFLLKLRYPKGRLKKTLTYKPILLDDPHTAWLVYAGQAEVFSVALMNGKPSGTRQHLFSATAGALLFGADLTRMTRGIVVMQPPDTQLLSFDRAHLAALAPPASLTTLACQLIDGWIARLTDIITPRLAPKEFTPLEAARAAVLRASENTIVRVHRGVYWITPSRGISLWSGDSDIALQAGELPLPLTRRNWLHVAPGCEIDATTTEMLLAAGGLWAALDHFNRLFLEQVIKQVQAQAKDEQNLFLQRAQADTRRFTAALEQIASAFEMAKPAPVVTGYGDALLGASKLVAEALGIALDTPSASAGELTLQNITQTARIRTREIALAGRWWTKDGGPLLGYLGTARYPVALLPETTSRYRLVNPASGSSEIVTEALADQLAEFGVQFYRAFSDEPLGARELLRFSLYNGQRDFRNLLFIGIGLGLLNLSIPVAVSILFGEIIPRGHMSQLAQIAFFLLLLTAATFVLQLEQRLAALRLESRAELYVGAALWDRLLSQKPAFFRRFTAGDLGNRMLGISEARSQLGAILSNALVQVTILLFNALIMLLINPSMGAASIGLMALALGVMAWWGARSLRYQRQLNAIAGENTGYVLQFINGIRKFRVAGAEKRVFAAWADRFTRQRRLTFQLRRAQNSALIFTIIVPFFALLLLFILGGTVSLSVGAFSAFFVAFTQFMSVGLELGASLIIASAVIPLYERAAPVLQSKPEIPIDTIHPGELHGTIEVNHLSFRYAQDQPLILDDINFKVEQGEFVAIVGASGSGKSTLLRLLLGFEQPETGAVYYDGKDLKDLDARAVRQQIGVVMQNGRLLAGGNLFQNIVGVSQRLTQHDAWEAARLVGLEKEIQAMPMGLQTLVTEGGSTLSGGQQQRLLIAAAIINKPRIVFFDEATSALDNRAQQLVSESLENIDATRIVIAHRLSTISNADTIIVMENGRIVQKGTYDKLIRENGAFADMAKRQLV